MALYGKKKEDVVSFSKDNIPILRDNLKNEIYKDSLNTCSQLIVGDNYLTLINLNFIYKNEVDVIYIDPPYNTGEKDWKFNDNFVDKEDSFRHSKWLSMMNVRLNLAKNLLKNDGLLLVSIGDDEFANLKLLLDQIFGESAFICDIPWQKRTSKSDVPMASLKTLNISWYMESRILSQANQLFVIITLVMISKMILGGLVL